MKVGVVTIGQTPREDLISQLIEDMGPNLQILEAGALDGMSKEEVAKIAPGPGDYVLVTRLRDGTPVKINKKAILPKIQRCITQLEEKGAGLILLLCTGEFPEFKSERLIVRPDRILESFVRSVIDRGRIGVVAPAVEQTPIMKRKWGREGIEVIIKSANPYAKRDELGDVADELSKVNVDLIVLDCMGFRKDSREKVLKKTGKPVVLPSSLLAHSVRQLVG